MYVVTLVIYCTILSQNFLDLKLKNVKITSLDYSFILIVIGLIHQAFVIIILSIFKRTTSLSVEGASKFSNYLIPSRILFWIAFITL